jgi:hypothetical protein
MSESRSTAGVLDLAGLAGLALLGCGLVGALLHLRDLSGIQHLAGIWMALAAYLDQGVFYPPLEADGFYAGTRYMPLLFGLIAALARLTGSYLVAAKLAALFSTLLLLGGVFAAARRFTGRPLDAFAFAALLLAFPEGSSALLSPHADALPVALAVWGLLLAGSAGASPSPSNGTPPAGAWIRACLAAALFALALSAKFSAVAAPAAGALFLWQQGRKRLAALEASLFLLLTGLSVAAIEWASGGRFLDNFGSLGSGGMSADSIRIGPSRLVIALFQVSPFLLVWPASLFLLVRRWGDRAFSVWEWYLLATLGTTAVIFTSPGTGFNHLLEAQTACVLVLARTPSSAPRSSARPGSMVLRPALCLVVLLLGLWRLAGPEDPSAVSPRELTEALSSAEDVLAEDASVPVLLGRRPVVMDAFAFRVLAEQGGIDDRPLARRIREQRFDALVMMARIDRPEETLCPRFHFGPRVTEAMLRCYRFERRIGLYCIYRPSALRSSGGR